MGGGRTAAPVSGNLAGIREAIRDAAADRDEAFGDWTETTQAKLQKRLMCSSQNLTVRTRSNRLNLSDTRQNQGAHFSFRLDLTLEGVRVISDADIVGGVACPNEQIRLSIPAA